MLLLTLSVKRPLIKNVCKISLKLIIVQFNIRFSHEWELHYFLSNLSSNNQSVRYYLGSCVIFCRLHSMPLTFREESFSLLSGWGCNICVYSYTYRWNVSAIFPISLSLGEIIMMGWLLMSIRKTNQGDNNLYTNVHSS